MFVDLQGVMETAEKVKSRTVYPSWVESVKMGQLHIDIYSLAYRYEMDGPSHAHF